MGVCSRCQGSGGGSHVIALFAPEITGINFLFSSHLHPLRLCWLGTALRRDTVLQTALCFGAELLPEVLVKRSGCHRFVFAFRRCRVNEELSWKLFM